MIRSIPITKFASYADNASVSVASAIDLNANAVLLVWLRSSARNAIDVCRKRRMMLNHAKASDSGAGAWCW